MFKDKTLLITGGTGSFGNAVLEKFLHSEIKEIRIFSRDEKKQHDMRVLYKNDKLRFHIGDVRDFDSVNAAMQGVDYVFSAAALKQVPSCEFYPINAMGMSKALMEKVAVAMSRNVPADGTVVSVTRYGNVMSSRGSVIPLFVEQIKNGAPITITDPDMTRFMMSLPDAVELVMFAFENGQQGDTFVQKSPAATIMTLAEALKELFNADNEIRIIGTRHSEKKHETLLSREELLKADDLGNYFRVPADNRDLNYARFFEKGQTKLSMEEDYTSGNTHILDKQEMMALLLSTEFIQSELAT